MKRFFAQRPTRPATISTDTIIPMHSQDDNPHLQAMVLDFTMRFDDVLDPEKLRVALVRLMQMGNWRKLGARLRVNDASKLEYHVPESFNEERPGFIYTHVKHDMSIKDHALASKLPKVSSRPSVEKDPAEFSSLARRPDAPTKVDDYLSSDEPQISLHVVSFRDVTLVSLTYLHCSFDAMGISILWKVWALVLCGQENLVPPLHGFDTDPLVKLGASPSVQYVLANRQLSRLSMLLFGIRYFSERLWWRKEEQHNVCLPHSYLQAMKNTALQELTSRDESEGKPFLSDGDIICAWWTRLAIQNMPSVSTRMIVILNAFNLRSVLTQDLLPSGTAYTSNAISALFALLPAYQIFQKPLSFVAAQIRQSIQEQGTRNQMETFTALVQKTIRETGGPPVFGDSSTEMIMFSNWSKAKFFDIDFSSAVTTLGVPLQGRANAIGRPSYIHHRCHMNGVSSRNSFHITGKDGSGNYWLGGAMRASSWRKVEEVFATM